jgi:hypothetical protein
MGLFRRRPKSDDSFPPERTEVAEALLAQVDASASEPETKPIWRAVCFGAEGLRHSLLNEEGATFKAPEDIEAAASDEMLRRCALALCVLFAKYGFEDCDEDTRDYLISDSQTAFSATEQDEADMAALYQLQEEDETHFSMSVTAYLLDPIGLPSAQLSTIWEVRGRLHIHYLFVMKLINEKAPAVHY